MSLIRRPVSRSASSISISCVPVNPDDVSRSKNAAI
jgi:hypothetical protein